MALKLSYMESDDFPRAFQILSAAFGRRQPFMNEFYPGHDTQAGQVEGALRLKAMADDPYTTFLKVVDPKAINQDGNAGRMIGMAKWNIYKDNTLPPPVDIMEGPWWDDGKGDRTYANLLATAFFERRNKALTASGGNLLVLDYIAVDPEYQRRGAATMLMQWGVDMADKYNIGGIIEATDQGEPLYNLFGYRALEHYSLKMPPPYDKLPEEKVAWMERPRKDGFMWPGLKTTTNRWLDAA